MPDDTPTAKPEDTATPADSVFDEIADDSTVMAPKLPIVFYDDDATPVDFVMAALENILGYDEPQARVMVEQLGREGKLVVARLQRTPAEQAIKRIKIMAENGKYPFKVELVE
ncbi:ATP-dependent Clp protease adaptor ClpS [Planctomycetota bacterium]|nr:ATP-dependent Clp protease adaptor ClpS [Planctomycetota bacterium]